MNERVSKSTFNSPFGLPFKRSEYFYFMNTSLLLRLPLVRRVSTSACVQTCRSIVVTNSSDLCHGVALGMRTAARFKGDFNMNTLHNSNPQHGASYDQQERKARDDEIEDFLLSVKGWDHNPNTDAIKKTFTFENFDQSYEFMGRLFSFCWATDKYPPVTWHGNRVTVELYSAHFKGLSKRELRIAAFCNDHFNMIRKSHQQIDKLKDVSMDTTMERLVGESVQKATQERDATFINPTPEAKSSEDMWKSILGGKIN